MINKKNLNMAGWMSVVSALFGIPLVAVGIWAGLSGGNNTGLNYLSSILNACYTGIFIYIFVMFRRLLNEFANFYDTDKYISFFIWINVAIAFAGLVVTPYPSLLDIHSMVSIILLIPFGIIYIIFGFKLLKCENDLFGYLKPLSYLTIITGILTSVVFLIMFSMLTSIALEVFLALIFFKAAKEYGNSTSDATVKASQVNLTVE